MEEIMWLTNVRPFMQKKPRMLHSGLPLSSAHLTDLALTLGLLANGKKAKLSDEEIYELSEAVCELEEMYAKVLNWLDEEQEESTLSITAKELLTALSDVFKHYNKYKEHKGFLPEQHTASSYTTWASDALGYLEEFISQLRSILHGTQEPQTLCATSKLLLAWGMQVHDANCDEFVAREEANRKIAGLDGLTKW